MEKRVARPQWRAKPVAVPAVAPREKGRVPGWPESKSRPCVLAACWFEIPILWPFRLASLPLGVCSLDRAKRATGCMPRWHTLQLWRHSNYGAFRRGLQTAREERMKIFSTKRDYGVTMSFA